MNKTEFAEAQQCALHWLKSYKLFVGCDGTFVWQDKVQPEYLINEERMAYYLLRALEVVARTFTM
jgi:hypothetical protein